jgi:uncharacterized pyridoxamine 5'-phosphate oxidase family protein
MYVYLCTRMDISTHILLLHIPVCELIFKNRNITKHTHMCKNIYEYIIIQADGNPHLSLMNFTYSRPDEVIILSTRRNTKKFFQIVDNPKVAILVHDFPSDEVSIYI